MITRDELESEFYEKGPWVEDIKHSGEPIIGVYVVRSKSFNKTKYGKTYANLELVDKTGSIEAKIWDNAVILASQVDVGNYALVVAESDLWKKDEKTEVMQLKIRKIKRVSPEKVILSDFLPSLPEEEIERYFVNLVDTLQNVKKPYLRKLIDSFFGDGDFVRKFKRAPASLKLHRAYIGGLVEHTYGAVSKAKQLAEVEDVDLELVLTGEFIHDIGKIESYKYTNLILPSEKANKVGHIHLGWDIISKKIDEIDGFPEELKYDLLHILVTHQGDFEETTRKPATPEAEIVHYADLIQSRFEMREEASRMNTEGWILHNKLGLIRVR